jgi:ATP-dependent Lon protease
MIGLTGDPGLGKTYICESLGDALGNGYSKISLNGKNSPGIIYGTSIDNPGAEMGGVVKAISENKSQFALVLFDEIEKSGKEAKDAIGEPTDRTSNKRFKDSLFDFPTPCNNLMFFCALNYAEELPDFISDRFTMTEVKPSSYKQRIDILRSLLAGSLKKFDEPFRGI